MKKKNVIAICQLLSPLKSNLQLSDEQKILPVTYNIDRNNFI